MKIKKLIFQNLNSLYGKWEIDFDCEKFRQSGLFAITGKTGSGKSTILDAMTLALYGSTPRLSKSTLEAVSRGCCECMSELTFLDTRNREWTATYAYETVKRGQKKGTMKETAIHRLCCNGKTEAEKTTEVRKMVEEITGLDATRFCRAVLLAQGSFDAFLNAGSDNGEILERITGTEIYSGIAAKVKERNDSEKSKLAEIEARFSGIQILPEEIAAEKRKEAEELEKQIIQLSARQSQLNTLLNCFQQLELQNAALEKCCAAEKELAQAEEEFSPLRQRLEEGQKALEADKFFRSYKELQDFQDSANAALQKALLLLKEQEELCVKSGKELELASLKDEESGREFEKFNALLTDVRKLDNTIELLKSNAAAAADKRTGALLQALEKRREYWKQIRRLDDLQKEHSKGITYLNAHPDDGELEGIRKLCAEWLESVKKLSLDLKAARRQEQTLRRNISEMEKNCTAKEELLKKETAKLSELTAEKEKIRLQLTELLGGASKEHWNALAEKQEQCLRQSLLLRSLEEHRRKLIPGEACPLCGALEHPFAAGVKAEPEKETQELEQTRKRLLRIGETELLMQKNEAALEICSNSQIQQRDSLQELQKQLSAQKEELELLCLQKLKAIEEEISQTSSKIDSALAPFGIVREKESLSLPELLNSRIAEFNKHRAAREEFESKKKELQETLLRLQSAFETQFVSCRVLKKEQAAEEAKLNAEKLKRRELFGNRECDAESRKAEEKRKISADALAKARQNSTEALTNRERTQKEIRDLEHAISERASEIINARTLFLHACKTSGLTEEMFHACVLEKEEMTALAVRDTELKSRKKQLAENRKNCEESLTALKKELENQPEKEKLLEEQKELSEQFREKNQQFGALREQLKQDADNKVRMAAEHQKLQEQKKIAGLWNRMHDLIGSKDRFQRFAQGITLEHLLVLANLELAKLSDRYRLLRSTKEELGIDVADKDQGDEIRSCKTLSGGERFLVSLALALGLSQMAGEKIRVDSLFLDEGFGTLDSETLDTALEALSSLRNRGKLVGVISHVAEFSEKIPCSIQVTKQGGGRSIIQGPGVKQL